MSVSIRKLQWLPPQPPSTDGCLFVLLGAIGGSSAEVLKSVIVGLAAVNTPNGGLDQVLSIPPSSHGKYNMYDGVYIMLTMLNHSPVFVYV